jgi:NTE family protein
MADPHIESSIILAGAFAKGAFEAGVLEVLSRDGITFRRIVSASAGSLNAVIFAAGVRVGRAHEAAQRLVELWSDYASWDHVFSPSVHAIVGLHGLSKTDKIRALLARELPRFLDDASAPSPAARTPIELRIVVSPLNGRVDRLGPGRATTFETVLPFDSAALDDPTARERMIDAAVASAAFPLIFLPVDLGPGIGLTIDGGAVDNAPIHEAIHQCPVDRVFVIAPNPPEMPPLTDAAGEMLVNRMADILVGERLFRDMTEAYRINDALRGLDALVTDGTLTPAQLARIHETLGWEDFKHIDLVPIRPASALQGGHLTGFFSSEVRLDYIRLGRQAAEEALARLR